MRKPTVIGVRRGGGLRQLSRDMLVDSGLGMLTLEGLDAVTMRSVARDMGWTASSLYHYVDGRRDLLGAMLDRVLGAVEVPDFDPSRWREQLVELVVDCRTVLCNYPGMARVAIVQMPDGANAVAIGDLACACARESGVDGTSALWAVEALLLFAGANALACTAYLAAGRPESRVDEYLQTLGRRYPLAGTGEERFRFAVERMVGGMLYSPPAESDSEPDC